MQSPNSALQALTAPLFSRFMPHLNSLQLARLGIDQMPEASGWTVQDYKAFDPSSSSGIALREIPLKSVLCDYLQLANRNVVAEVERRLSVVEELEAVITAKLQRGTRLPLSILQKAFTGELA